MSRSQYLQRAVQSSLVAAALAVAIDAQAADTLPEVTVTAQKRAESIQDVPIAVSAFNESELSARGLDGGPNILQAIPNVSFSKSQFTSFNLQIRGVGTKLVGASGDQGVGIHLNNAPLVVSRFFEAEFYDVERIEVLRGPQGTVYGRNATGGVFNAITAKPTDKFEASITLDAGNYESQKIKGMVNVPMGEMFQLRLAGSVLQRDGYMFDSAHGKDIDSRDLGAGRATLGYKFGDSVRGYLMWEHFEEHDDRQRVGKQLCHKDTGPATVGGVSTTVPIGATGAQARWYLTQGCLPGSLYSSNALQPINSSASLGGMLANLIGLQSGDAFAGKTISSNMREAETANLPVYDAESDIAMLNIEFDVTDDLLLTSLTSYNDDELESRSDYNRAVPSVNFNSIPGLAPGGFFNDPQIGSTNKNTAYDISGAVTRTWTQELRLQSAFDGPINFNVGAIYMDLDSPDPQGRYFVVFNTGTAYARAAAPTVGIDPNVDPTGFGHNYYVSRQPYTVRSTAAFGELYWNITDSFKLTGGLRYTDDKKTVDNYGIVLLAPGFGWTPAQITHQEVEFQEVTGRGGFDWQITDDMMVYGFVSRGYKAGGLNPPTQSPTIPPTFEPEFVNAVEIGSKNTFAGGALQLNGTAFYYDYEGYQIARLEQKTSINSNVDAKIAGAELEFAWQPLSALRLDSTVGFLKTEIQGGSAIDLMNRTQGNPNQTVIKASDGANCVVPTAGLAALVGLINAGTPFIPVTGGPNRAATPTDLLGACSGSWTALGIVPSEGTAVSLDGKELPNSPELTFNLGVQTMFGIGDSWRSTLRGDFYYQGESFARIYNTEYDRLHKRTNVNLSLSFDNDAAKLNVLLYVKNALDDDDITDAYLTDDSSGLWTNTFLPDPRLFGLSLTKKF